MAETGKMIIKLAVLVVPAIILFCSLYIDNKGDGVGGGGYDLSELVYSGFFTLFVICWNVWVIVSLLMAKTALDKQNNMILLAIGVLALIGAAIWFNKHL